MGKCDLKAQIQSLKFDWFKWTSFSWKIIEQRWYRTFISNSFHLMKIVLWYYNKPGGSITSTQARVCRFFISRQKQETPALYVCLEAVYEQQPVWLKDCVWITPHPREAISNPMEFIFSQDSFSRYAWYSHLLETRCRRCPVSPPFDQNRDYCTTMSTQKTII